MRRNIGMVRVAVSAMAFISLAAPAFSAVTSPKHEVAINPESTKLLKRGYGELSLSLYQPAIENLRHAVEIDSRNISARRYLVYALLHEGQTAEALNQLKAVTDGGKGSGEDYSLLGEAHLNIGWIDAAELDFRKALSLEPNLTSAEVGLVKIHVCNSNFDEALKLCKDCIEQAKAAKNQNLVDYFRTLFASINASKLNSIDGRGGMPQIELPKAPSIPVPS